MEGNILMSDAQQAHENNVLLNKQDLIRELQAKESGCFDCNICLDTAHDPVVTLCGHLFCWPCIYKWLHVKLSSSVSIDHNQRNNCPVCKSNVTITSLVPLYGRGIPSSSSSSSTFTIKKQEAESTEIPRRPSPSITSGQALSPTFHNHQYPPRGGFATTTESTDLANAVMMSFLYPVIGMFGDLVYARIFGTFTNAIAHRPYQSQRMMQCEKSLNRVSIFLLCCICLCLLLF